LSKKVLFEKDLYKPVEDMFVKKGYFSISDRGKLPSERVHSPFGVEVHGVAKKIDVVAFRWVNDELEAKAVECKSGKTWEAAGEALGQATAYQRIFPEVYVATEAEEKDLKHVESLLRELGLGYISVINGETEEIFPPAHNIRFNQKDFSLQVKCKAIALLATSKVLEHNNFQFGRADSPGHIWISSLEPCNISCSIEDPGNLFWFALNLEKKPAIRRIFSIIDAGKFYSLLSALPSDYHLYLWKFASYRPKKYTEEEIKPISELKPSDIVYCINKIKDWNWQAHIQIGKSIFFDTLSETLFISEFKKAIGELSALQNFLNT